ncbi:MAG: hypothetical protein V4617_13240 [Gemmatimonadota bacterium]
MRVRSLIPLPLALLMPALLAAQAGETVRFKFGWTPGLVADIATTSSVTTGTGRPPTAQQFKLRLTTASHPDGIRVQTTAPDAGANPRVNGFDLAAANSAAESIVSRDGAYLRLMDTVKTRRMMDSVVNAMTANLAGMPPAARDKMKSMLSIAYIEQASRQAWDQQTRSFLGRTWKTGEEVIDTMRAPHPMSMGAMTLAAQRTVLVGVVPCDSAAKPGLRCAHMRRVSTLDPASLRAVMMETMKELAPGMSESDLQAALPAIEAVTTTDMLLEIETLLVRRVTSTMMQKMAIMGNAQQNETSTTVTYTYTSR